MGNTHRGTTPTASRNSGAAKTDSSHCSVFGNGRHSVSPYSAAYAVCNEHAQTTSASVNSDPPISFRVLLHFNVSSTVCKKSFKTCLASAVDCGSKVTPRCAPIPTIGYNHFGPITSKTFVASHQPSMRALNVKSAGYSTQPGLCDTRNRAIALLSKMQVPSSVSSTGTLPNGFFLRNSGVRLSTPITNGAISRATPAHAAAALTRSDRPVLPYSFMVMVSCGHRGARYARVSRSGVRVAVVARVALHAWPNVGLYRTTISATRKF
mmetsp:Transcript_14199/g.47063  ORF Transcript_14199/g.47063 Transcript_14199/m.47063 type:complete len:266 (+) Transcript_14199:1434-2231(+)